MHALVLLLPLTIGGWGPGGCATGPVAWPHDYATVRLIVDPPDAVVWIDEHEVQTQGADRSLITPPLTPGYCYTYRVTAQWGDTVRTWKLLVEPGKTSTLKLRPDLGEQCDRCPKGCRCPCAGKCCMCKRGKPCGAKNCRCASPAPASDPVIEQDGTQNYGVDRQRLSGREHITADGREVTLEEAKSILASNSLTDDSAKLRLTVIGSEADRQRVLDDLRGPLADLANEYIVQSYAPDHWAVVRAGFKVDGKPTIYLQMPNGRVLHRQDDYADGSDGLRRALEAVRKPDPNYDPNKDSDLRKLMQNSDAITWGILALGGVCLLIALRKG